jgi:hypothetical protein
LEIQPELLTHQPEKLDTKLCKEWINTKTTTQMTSTAPTVNMEAGGQFIRTNQTLLSNIGAKWQWQTSSPPGEIFTQNSDNNSSTPLRHSTFDLIRLIIT